MGGLPANVVIAKHESITKTKFMSLNIHILVGVFDVLSWLVNPKTAKQIKETIKKTRNIKKDLSDKITEHTHIQFNPYLVYYYIYTCDFLFIIKTRTAFFLT